MSEPMTKPIVKKASGNSHTTTLPTVKKIQKVAAAASPGPIAQTIFVQDPHATTQPCTTPFQATGFAVSGTIMNATAEITRGFGTPFIGNLSSSPPPGMWAYDFSDALPCGVLLALIVTGTTSSGATEQVVVPFECEC